MTSTYTRMRTRVGAASLIALLSAGCGQAALLGPQAGPDQVEVTYAGVTEIIGPPKNCQEIIYIDSLLVQFGEPYSGSYAAVVLEKDRTDVASLELRLADGTTAVATEEFADQQLSASNDGDRYVVEGNAIRESDSQSHPVTFEFTCP